MSSTGLTKELTIRIIAITVIYSIISFIVFLRNTTNPIRLEIVVPLLFATYGIVILISTLHSLRKYHITNIT